MIGIVVKYAILFDVRHIAQPGALLPARMAPADAVLILVVRIHPVIDHQIGAFDQVQNILVGLPRGVFRVGQIANRLALVIYPVTGRAIGMIENAGLHFDIRIGMERRSGFEIVKRQLALKNFERHREQRRHHQFGQRITDGVFGEKMTGPDLEFVGRQERRAKKRQAADMIEMGVGQIEAGLEVFLAHEAVTEVTQAGTRIEHQEVIAAPNFEGGRVAAVFHDVRRGARDATAHAPEPNVKIVTRQNRDSRETSGILAYGPVNEKAQLPAGSGVWAPITD